MTCTFSPLACTLLQCLLQNYCSFDARLDATLLQMLLLLDCRIGADAENMRYADRSRGHRRSSRERWFFGSSGSPRLSVLRAALVAAAKKGKAA